MAEQESHSNHIPSLGGGETPHPWTGPDDSGSRIDTAAKNEQAEAKNKDLIKETAKQATDSDVKHQGGHGAGQSLTAGDQRSGPAPAGGEQRLSGTVPDNSARDAMKLQEPKDNSMAQVVENPATGNVPLTRPPRLTRIAEFWKRYDKLADNEDQRLSKNLDANLDVLLIFAALFSAINTAFISMTMPSLSPAPLDRTNTLLELLVKRVDNSTLTPSDLTPSFSPQASSIAINFLLYASLCCSLLAAMGAMLGKEWLQSFDRSGQTGPLEEQGRFRQRKFNGILQWHLEGTILFLPNLLVFSVTLFFAGLALYLLPINKAVAGLLIAVLSFSVGVWQVTVLAGAIWPLCPYQSAASRAVRLVGLGAASYWEHVRRPGGGRKARTWPMVKTAVLATLSRWEASFLRVLTLGASSAAAHDQPTHTRKEGGNELRAKEEQIANAQAAFWLIKTASSWEDRAVAAEFITTFDDVPGSASQAVLQEQGNWQRLLRSTREAFENWYYQPNDANRNVVENFGRALSHLALQQSKTAVKWKPQAEPKPGQSTMVFERFLHGLETAFTITKDRDIDSELLAYAALLRALADSGNIYSKSRSWERLFVLMGDFDFSLLNRQVTYAFWEAAHALRLLPESHPETSAFKICSTFLQEIRHVATTEQLPGDLVSLLKYSVAEFIFDFNKSLWANKGAPNLKSDKSLMEALLSLHAIISSGSLPTSSVRDDTQGAFGDRDYRSSSANRKIVESFGRAPSDVGLLHPQNAVKWRSWAEGESNKLHDVLERFLKGFRAASKRMIDKDADWELLIYATSLYGLEATGDTYTKSRSWERLFVLMGDFDFSLLNRQVTYAFWNAAHALRSLPESHPETSAFDIYSTFLQEIRHVAATDQLPSELVSLLTYSAVEFILDFNESFGTNPVSPNLKLDKFSAEALLPLRAILPRCSFPTSSVQDRFRELRGRTSWRSSKRTWDSTKWNVWGLADFDDFWRALDSIITKLTESPPEIKELTVDFVLAAVEWLSISLRGGGGMTGLARFPQIPTFIALSLAEGNPARQTRCLDLFFFNNERLILQSSRIWVEVGLVAKLVGMVKEPQTWSNGTRLLEVLEIMVKNSYTIPEGLVGAGFNLAATRAIQHFDKTRERLWEDLLRRTLAITLQVWNYTKSSNRSKWAASDMLLMVRHSSVHLAMSLNSKKEGTWEVQPFVELIDLLYKRRSLAAFISCNADVAVRSLFCELRRRVEGGTHLRSNAGGDASASPDTDVDDDLRWAYRVSQAIDWNYVLYGLPEAPVLCFRQDFVGTRWQML